MLLDDYSEELLRLHEEEAERLRAEIESKVTLLPKVRDWHSLVADEAELERSASDPNRFSRRGGALLREEKLRKRVTALKPKVPAGIMWC
jgi:protein regulator of cytokinesis 1